MSVNVLHITASIFGENGVSTQLTKTALEKLKATIGDVTVIERDLTADALPHFNLDTITAVTNGEAKLADTLIEELKAADLILLGLPMYNFGVPSQFKAWVDHVARAGTTFKYTETGPVGLLDDRKVIVAASRGGIYNGTDMDTQTPYLTHFLGFIGIKDLEFVYAEGVNLDGSIREDSIAKAQHAIEDAVVKFAEQVQEKSEAV